MRHGTFQPAALHVLSAGLDAAGKPVACIHRCATFHLSMFGPYKADDPELYDGSPWGGPDTPYAFPALRVDYAPLEAPVPTGAWRSVEYPSTVFARESFAVPRQRLERFLDFAQGRVRAFNADRQRRTCPRCGAVHPPSYGFDAKLDSDDERTLAARILEQEHLAYTEAINIVLSGKFTVTGRRLVTNVTSIRSAI